MVFLSCDEDDGDECGDEVDGFGDVFCGIFGNDLREDLDGVFGGDEQGGRLGKVFVFTVYFFFFNFIIFANCLPFTTIFME